MKYGIHLIVISVIAILLAAYGPQAASPSAPGIVPTSLQTIEAAAEDIIDYAPSGNWSNYIDQKQACPLTCLGVPHAKRRDVS